MGYALSSLGDKRFALAGSYPMLPWLAVAVGLWVADAIRHQRRAAAWPLVAAGFVIVIQQDLVASPAPFAFVHILGQAPKYPADLELRLALRAFGLGFAALFVFALAPLQAGLAPIDRADHDSTQAAGLLARATRWLSDGLGWITTQLLWLAGALRWRVWFALTLLAIGFSVWCTQYLTPALEPTSFQQSTVPNLSTL